MSGAEENTGNHSFFIPRLDNSFRTVHDCRFLNSIITRDHCPLPLISDLLGTPSKGIHFHEIGLQKHIHCDHNERGL